MTDLKKSEEIALNRYKIITPILLAFEEKADGAKLTKMKKDTCEQNGISYRTLMRWLDGYQKQGFEGLKVTPRNNGNSVAIPEEIIVEAILLRRELPSRSIPQIIEILEMEGKAVKGQLKRSTLQDNLQARGYSTRQMKMYQSRGVAARRFVRLERNDMWHSDIKYGPFITINGIKKQIYLVAFLDDATRYVVHAEFYDNLDQTVVEDCFRKAIVKEGLPQRVYFDNGKQYRTKWMERACAMLEIKLLYAKPYSPESTGKIERFNRTVDSFFAEVSLKRPRSLNDYNKLLDVWLNECYHTRPHGGLVGGLTPEIAYKSSKSPLRFMPIDVIASAFMRLEQRKVDKSGCISFSGKKYEISVLLIGQKVNVIYDPNHIETIIIEHDPSGSKFQAKELKIGAHTGPRPKLPKSMMQGIPETSRFLDGLEKRHESRHDAVRRAISYKDLNAGEAPFGNGGAALAKDGESHV